MSIRARIALFGSGVIAVTLLVFALLLHGVVGVGLERDQDDLLATRSEQAVAAIAASSAADFTRRDPIVAIDLRTDLDPFVAVLDATGAVLTSTGLIDGTPPMIDPSLLSRARESGHEVATIQPGGVGLRVDVRPWSRPDLGQEGYVVAGQATARIDTQLRGLGQVLWVSSLLVLIGAFVASWRVAGRALKPLRTIVKTTDAIGATEDLAQRLPPLRRKDELGRLTASFNAMLDRVQASQTRLAAALDAQKRFVADASHELRTPLTTIRSNAGFLLGRPDVRPDDREAALQDIVAESERMSRLVQDLLTLARADAGHRLVKTRFDLLPLVQDVHRRAQRLHPTRDIVLDVEAGRRAALTPNHSLAHREREDGPSASRLSPSFVLGNADALVQLLWILIDNAVNHTQRGGCITLALRANDEAERIEFSVRDDGSGIPPDDLPRIFDRFYQADRARTGGGAGLGLAIAAWIAAEHDAYLHADNNPDRGATFTLELPVAGSR